MNRTSTKSRIGGGKSDSIILRGQFTITASTGAAGNGVINGGFNSIELGVDTIGSRPGVAATIYERYRFRNIDINYVPIVGSTTAGGIAFAISDDINISSEVATTYSGTVPYRQSQESQVWNRASVKWTPIDRTKWYYTSFDGAGEARLVVPCSFIANGIGLTPTLVYGEFIVRYIIEFEGGIQPFTPV